jgi:hypothetical protein
LGDAGHPGVLDVMLKLITQAVILVAVSVLTSGLRFAAILVAVMK